jgi:23S rRNA pseudouridine1911/1915/1917 synthase
MSFPSHRQIQVPEVAAGMRLDRFLAVWFQERSRSELVRGIRAGQVCSEAGKKLRPSSIVRAGERLYITIPGIAPTEPPPAFPPILYADEELIVIDKPAGLMCHPAGSSFTWAVIGLARERWPEEPIDLVHRIDRDTSGLLMLTRTPEANQWYKAFIQRGDCTKEYLAITKGRPAWETQTIEGPIGKADGPIRIQMAVRADGAPARTDVTVLERHPEAELSLLRCRLHTGRTHQIRVHLESVGFPLLGDRIYGVKAKIFLHAWEFGADESTFIAAGAPRHALHCARLLVQRPSGEWLELEAPLAPDLQRWWDQPQLLPLDQPPRQAGEERSEALFTDREA